MAQMARSSSASPPPLMTPASPSSASSSDVDIGPPSPRLIPRQHVPIVRVATEPGSKTSHLLWEDTADETLIGVAKAATRHRRPLPRRRDTVAAAETLMSRSTSMILPASYATKQTSPVKMPQSTSFYTVAAGRRASTSLLPAEAPRPTCAPTTHGSSSSGLRTEADPETLNAKMCVIGDAGVGKTSLINRYITGSFSTNQPSTIGASLLIKKMVLPEGKINFQLWDTAGQERFRSLAPMYYRDCEAAAIVFDLTNRASFLAVKQWLIQIRKHAQNRDNLVLHFVGTKLDLASDVDEDDPSAASASQRQVSAREAKELIHQWLCEPEREDVGAPAPGSPRLAASPPRRQPSPSFQRTSTEGERPFIQRTTSLFDFLPGRRAPVEPTLPPQPWAVWDYSEVSAKHNIRVDDIFRITSQRLLRRRRRIQHQQDLRHRHSIYLSEANARATATLTSATTATGYTCC